MCRVMRVHHSGFYAWLHEPDNSRAKENKRLLGLILDSYNASDGIYGSRRVYFDLQEMGESCSENRIARLMKQHGIKAVRGYKKPRYKTGHPGDCKLDCVSAYIPLGDKPDETIRNRSLRPQSGARH